MKLSLRQKLNRKVIQLTDVVSQMDLANIYRTSHKQKNILSSLHLMELSPKLTPFLKVSQSENPKAEWFYSKILPEFQTKVNATERYIKT